MCKNPKAQIYGVQKTSQSLKLKYTLQAREQCDNPGQRAGDVSSPWGLCLPPHHVLLLWLNAGGLCFFPFLCLFPFVCLPLIVSLCFFSFVFLRLPPHHTGLFSFVCLALLAVLFPCNVSTHYFMHLKLPVLVIEVPNLVLNNRSINCSFSLPSALQWLPLLPLPSSFYPCVRYHFLWIIFLNDITFTTPMPHSLLQPFCPNCDSHFLNKMSQVALLLFQHYPVKCHFIFISSSQR